MIHVADIAGRKLACWISNGSFHPDRRTLAFIHGSGGNHTDWILQYTPLKSAFNVMAIDLPGHGESEGPGEKDVAAYVAWVRKILEALGIVKPILIGHSLGAAICLSFAILYDDAAAVVSVGGGVRMPVNPAILDGLEQDPAGIIALAAKFSVAKETASGSPASSPQAFPGRIPRSSTAISPPATDSTSRRRAQESGSPRSRSAGPKTS
jgi:pimeloyl-ACP methyl ester carboxylesterase